MLSEEASHNVGNDMRSGREMGTVQANTRYILPLVDSGKDSLVSETDLHMK